MQSDIKLNGTNLTIEGHKVDMYGILNFYSHDGKKRGYLDVRWGNLHLGGNGQDGDIFLFNGDGDKTFHISGDQPSMTFYSVKNWPTYTPGRSTTTNVNLLQELKTMKEQIVQLKVELASLRESTPSS